MHLQLGSSTTGVGSSDRGAAVDSKLVASSDEVWWSWYSNLVARWELEPEAVISFDPEDWVDPKMEANSEMDVEPYSELEASSLGKPISVCFPSDW